MEEAKEIIEGFILSQKWKVLELSIITFLSGMNIHIKFKVPFWDAQIAGISLTNGVSQMITEDKGSKKIEGIRVINPFK